MRGWAAAVLLVAGCGGSPEVPDPAAVEVRTWLDDPALMVQVEAGEGIDFIPPEPRAEGLELEPEGEPRLERLSGDRELWTWRYRVEGPSGHFRVEPLEVQPEDGGEPLARAPALHLDRGVAPPRPGEMMDIEEPAPVRTFPWGWVVALAGAAGLGAWALRRRKGRRDVPQMPQPLPADVRALRAWEQVREDPSLDELERAVALSRIFRNYVEEVLRFPASSWTSAEIARHLEGMAHLPKGNVPRARKLLRATDLVKYADVRGQAALFEELDTALRAFVASTRPRRMEL